MSLLPRKATWKRATISVVAAYALALHALLSALAGFAHGSQAAELGHVLCSPDAGASAAGNAGGVPAGMPSHAACCNLGAASGPPPSPAVFVVVRFPEAVPASELDRDPEAPPPLPSLPLGSRAPPRQT